MKFIIALATTFCLVGGYGMAAEYNGVKRPPAAINGNVWDQSNRQSQSDNRQFVLEESTADAEGSRYTYR